jgi:hypothetical protein
MIELDLPLPLPGALVLCPVESSWSHEKCAFPYVPATAHFHYWRRCIHGFVELPCLNHPSLLDWQQCEVWHGAPHPTTTEVRKSHHQLTRPCFPLPSAILSFALIVHNMKRVCEKILSDDFVRYMQLRIDTERIWTITITNNNNCWGANKTRL